MKLTLSSFFIAAIIGSSAVYAAEDTNGLQKQESSAAIAVKTEIQNMQQKLISVKQAVVNKNQNELKVVATKMHRHWLAFENNVRDLYPLLYTDVEKYETPIFYASSREKIDFAVLVSYVEGLENALKALAEAKESHEAVSEVLQQSVAKYRLYVMEQADSLVSNTQLFTDAIKAKDINKAKQYYAQARVFYERIEPVAEGFGDLDPLIDARIADIEPGDKWTGFHPLEQALWEKKSLEGNESTQLANQLMSDVLQLQKKVSVLNFEAKAMVAGAMELLNEAANTKITGEEEAYSHLDLLDFYANVEGAKAVYLAVIPALNVSQKELAEKLDKQFTAMEEALNIHKDGDDFVAYDRLKSDEIRKLANELTKLGALVKDIGKIF